MSNSGNIAAWGIGDYGEIGNSGFSSFNYPVYTGEKSCQNYKFEIRSNYNRTRRCKGRL